MKNEIDLIRRMHQRGPIQPSILSVEWLQHTIRVQHNHIQILLNAIELQRQVIRRQRIEGELWDEPNSEGQ